MTISPTPAGQPPVCADPDTRSSARALAPHLALQAARRQVNTTRRLVSGQAARVAALDPSQAVIIANAKRLLAIFQNNLEARERCLELFKRQDRQ